LILKFEIKRTSELSKLSDITKAVANALDLKKSAVRLLSVEEGCVLITFLIPTAVAAYLFTSNTKFSVHQVKAFSILSVLWLKCNGHTFEFKEDTFHSPKDQENSQVIGEQHL